MDRDQLITLCKTLKKEIDQTKKEATKYESEIRQELVGSWSKRLEETDAYYQ